jgi:hypothetical protein
VLPVLKRKTSMHSLTPDGTGKLLNQKERITEQGMPTGI